MKTKSVCLVKDCGRVHHAKGFCRRHYIQIQRKGKIFKLTRSDPNEVITDGDISYIIVRDKRQQDKARFMIDTADLPIVSQYKWWISNRGYVCTTQKNETILLHRLLLGTPPNMLTDHINMNTLDNRRANLRICNDNENVRNREKPITNKSGYKGVYWNRQSRKWDARISVNNKNIYLGLFADVKEGAKAYNEAAIKYHGAFARLNNLGEIPCHINIRLKTQC